jgi:hypothetical protein
MTGRHFQVVADYASRAEAARELGSVDEMVETAGCARRTATAYRSGERVVPLHVLRAMAVQTWDRAIVAQTFAGWIVVLVPASSVVDGVKRRPAAEDVLEAIDLALDGRGGAA